MSTTPACTASLASHSVASAKRPRNREHDRQYMRRYRQTPRGKYVKHKEGATRRGIPFLLTYEQWLAIWTASGKWHLRGNSADSYVMARPGDTGAYAVGNVKIITNRENLAEAGKKVPRGEANRRAKVTEADVLSIRRELAEGRRVAAVARSHGLPWNIVGRVKHGVTWAWL